MIDLEKWDWETPLKEIPLSEWKGTFRWVEEPHASPGGERIAAIVNLDEGEFNIDIGTRQIILSILPDS